MILLAGLLCVSAQAEVAPWSGSGTESDPWIIATAADLVSLREYIAAGENTTQGKYFRQTADISLSAYCGKGKGSWTPIGVWEGKSFDNYVFNGYYDGNEHTISGLYISNSTLQGVGLFAEIEAQGTMKDLSVTGYVEGAHGTGGIVGSNCGLMENCSFYGTVSGTEENVGGIAGRNSNAGTIKDCHFYGTVTGTDRYVGGIAGYAKGSIQDCSFSGTVSAPVDGVGGIVGQNTAPITGCEVDGDISGARYVGGIVGCSKQLVSNCNFNSGTVKAINWGYEWIGGIVGLANSIITDCSANGTIEGNLRVGGIAGETCKPISNCENYATVKSVNYAGGIAGHTFSMGEAHGTVENCVNYGDITVDNQDVGGIVGCADESVNNCANHGKIKGDHEVGGIVGYAASSVSACTNDGQVIGENKTGSIVGDSNSNAVVTLKKNGGFGTETSQTASVAPACPFHHFSYSFFAWNTKADGSGTYYFEGNVLPESDDLILYAIWMNRQDTDYMYTETKEQCAFSAILRDGVYYLPAGWYVADGNTTLTERLYFSGDANLILADGATLDADAGISVPSGSSLTIWVQQGGTGKLNATGASGFAGIGGNNADGQRNCGKIVINGGTIYAKGGNYGAGIGGGDSGNGGTVTINGGAVTASGKNGSAGIGGGDYGSGGTVTINGGSVTATGSTRSSTGQAGAGIGAGRPEPDGSQTLNGGSVSINSGTVLAQAGIPDSPSDGAGAIGANLQYSSPGSLTIAKYLRVSSPDSGAEPVYRSDRVTACHESEALITNCQDHLFSNSACHYCGVSMGLDSVFTGDGTGDTPCQIRNEEDWNKLAALFNEDSLRTACDFRLTNDITVSAMIGTENNPFRGTFDGNGHTLTFNSEDHPEGAAPFRYTTGATIRNLHVTGSITGSNRRASGLIGENSGTSTVTNCRVSATISGSSLIGGFCIDTGDALNITGCVFDGQITGGLDQSGCFAARGASGLSITDSMAAPQSGSAFTGGTFCYTDGSTAALTNCYYLTAAANAQGRLARSVTAGEGMTIDFGQSRAAYNVSGITAYPVGLKYNGVFCAGSGESVTMDLSCNAPEGLILHRYDAGTALLTETNGTWTLIMSDENAVISAQYVPAFGEPDFTLPASLTEIGEEAFEGAAMSVACIHDDCTAIGDHAFRNCPNLTRIRIPADCAIGADAFDGCTLIYVYSAVGSPAETYCSTHANCVFVKEAQD